MAPLLLFARGLGDLPQSLAYLRPLALMGDVGFEILTNAETETVVKYDVLLMYSLPYLHTHVRDPGAPWPFSRLVPLVEFNFETRVPCPSGIVAHPIVYPAIFALWEKSSIPAIPAVVYGEEKK